MKKFTISCIGCGSRGCDTYLKLAFQKTDQFEVVSLCDTDTAKLDKYGKIYNVDETNRFTDEEEFFNVKRSDALVIATLDKDHVRQCIKAIKLGYKILLEKPISSNLDELYELLDYKRMFNAEVLVCHVLRYSPAFLKVHELILSGVLGKLILIDSTEQIAYWHYAHSYVRGNWRKESDTAPMILAKSCHDLDLIQYYADSTAEYVQSVGDLAYFKAANAPVEAAKRCTLCRYEGSCPYSATQIYIEDWKKRGCPENTWPFNVLVSDTPVTEEKLKAAISSGPYGRCVFACDNDVADNQITTISFNNGVKAVLKTIAFTHDIGRITIFYGTDGEIELDETRGVISVKPFGKDQTIIKIEDLVTNDQFGHGGGDQGIMNSFYEMLCGNVLSETTLEKSVESHLIGIAAESSRKDGGKPVYIRHK